MQYYATLRKGNSRFQHQGTTTSLLLLTCVNLIPNKYFIDSLDRSRYYCIRKIFYSNITWELAIYKIDIISVTVIVEFSVRTIIRCRFEMNRYLCILHYYVRLERCGHHCL